MDTFQISPADNSSHAIFMRLVLILFLALLGTFIAGVLVQILGQVMGMDYMKTVQGLTENATNKEKNFIKIALCISHSCTFILPSIAFLWMTYKKDWRSPINLQPFPKLLPSLVATLLLLVAFPLVQFIFSINKQLPIPQWAIDQENLITNTIQQLLLVNAPSELFFNLFTIAVLPAIGEELLFRGIVQQNLEKGTKNHHIAIWLTALIFSFIHFQFQGFFPRLFLGAGLGYLFVWTRNLWIPIIAHLAYNGGQILLQYGHQQGVLGIDLNAVEMVPIWLVGVSLVGSFGLGWYFYQRRNLGDFD
ncbi:MAG: lysostaphin resistance A-like protein [Saprospiraceae bacterium]